MNEEPPTEATQALTESLDEDSAIDTQPVWGLLRSMNDKLPNYNITSTEIIVGRNPACAVVINDPRISKCHFKISFQAPPQDEDHALAFIEDTRFFI